MLALPFLPLLLAVVFLLVVFWLAYTACLHIVIWVWWCARGTDVLFIYSDSPVWHDYIEQQVLPHLANRALVLNWSQRKRWKLSVARMAFRHFGGYREFNPLAVVFRPLRRTRTFRFWKPFRQWKHGNAEPLQRMQSDFFELIGVTHTA